MNCKVRENLKMRALRCAGGMVYFFNENGIYQAIPVTKLLEDESIKLKGISFYSDGRHFLNTLETCLILECNNQTLFVKVVARLQEGDTFDRLDELLKTSKLERHEKLKGLDRFICKIDKPIFYRTPENIKKNTFDFIYVDVSILRESTMENREEYIKKNIKEITKKVVDKVEMSKSFQRYGVPINFLKVSRVTLLKKTSILQFVFELKIN